MVSTELISKCRPDSSSVWYLNCCCVYIVSGFKVFRIYSARQSACLVNESAVAINFARKSTKIRIFSFKKNFLF